MGTVLYELVTGSHPFSGDTELSIFANIMTKPPLPVGTHVKGEIPRAAEDIVRKCLRRAREERYGSMTTLAQALREVAA
jgi:eukaryotic-like serine/threonine-protein kinase